MASTQTMLVACGADSSFPFAKMEVPDQTVNAGEAMTLRAWATAPELLRDYVLASGATSLGPGTPAVWGGQTTCHYFDFAGDNAAQQFDWPIMDIRQVLAYSPVYTVSDAGKVSVLAPAGQNVTAAFLRRGGCGIVPVEGLGKLYGTVYATADRAPYCREWSWTAPSSPTGAQWFWLSKAGRLQHKFSLTMSDEPDDASVCYVDVRILVIDRKTAGAVGGAAVYLNGQYMGATDQTYGVLKLFRILSGTYAVKIVAPGFAVSSADKYSDNDSIVILPAGKDVRVKVGGYV